MAKKSDILVKYYLDFPNYLREHKTRLKTLERDFLRAKNDYQQYLDKIDETFKPKEEQLRATYMQIEMLHEQKHQQILKKYHESLLHLEAQIEAHHVQTAQNYQEEDQTYQEILNQFEDRKAEAFDTYLKLTKEVSYKIDREMKVHHEFIKHENEALTAKRIQYKDLNSTLSNRLLWTMEKAKNALIKLSETLTEQGTQNQQYLDQTIDESLVNLTESKDAMNGLFKTSSYQFEQQRNRVKEISKDKRKPHSEINQRMIATFVKQIRDVNQQKAAFEAMIKADMERSLSYLYPKIVDADASGDTQALEKFILQKEIIEKKVDYLLTRNQTLSDMLITKYQTEIKKIKIDSYKRFEEINIAYSVPVAFFQNSIDVYSNFAFYLNETFADLFSMLERFKQYNQDYIAYRSDYLHESQKTFEDYKINLLVKVNDITNHLTDYIQRIDELSHQIVTLESNNRLEIAEIRKKMENLDIFGDYQKYIASLDNDQFFAMHQHNKNVETIQIDSTYHTNLLDINREVLLLNESKETYQEYEAYMILLANHEKEIQRLGHERKMEETKAMYQQRIDTIIALRELARHRIIHQAKKTNYGYASSYVRHLNDTNKKNQLGSAKVIDFVHHVQTLIDINTKQANEIDAYIKNSGDQHAYLRALEKNRLSLIEQVDRTKDKKNDVCERACALYEQEILGLQTKFEQAMNHQNTLLKQELLALEGVHEHVQKIIHHNGYLNRILAVYEYVYKRTLTLAFKYHLPSVISKLEKTHEQTLEMQLALHIQTFSKAKHAKKFSKQKPSIKTYLVESIMQIDRFKALIDGYLKDILKKATKNDLAYIANTNAKALKSKAMINKEYERLEFYAIKHEKSQKRQLKHFKSYSNRINQLYKKQVNDINEAYLEEVDEAKAIRQEIYKKFTKIVKKNDKELKQMIRFMDKMFRKEQRDLDRQYASLCLSLDKISKAREETHDQEVAYIKTLYEERNALASKTIHALETRMDHLPVEKEKATLRIKQEKYELQTKKTKELRQTLAVIEKEKFVSKPKYLEEIEQVKNRLPEDYVALYKNIQHLEFDFLNQFSTINDHYVDNFNTYLRSQKQNHAKLQQHAKLYKAFEDYQAFQEKGLLATHSTYKETSQKSNRQRDEIKRNKQRSIDKQKRILND